MRASSRLSFVVLGSETELDDLDEVLSNETIIAYAFSRKPQEDDMHGEALTVPPQDRAAKEAAAITKAVLRAADGLGIRNATLSRVIGVSEPTLSRMRSGERLINRSQKEFELSVLFVRLYRSLDAIIGGDDTVSQQWLRNNNTALGSTPLKMIETVQGLTDVIRYLDARRAVI